MGNEQQSGLPALPPFRDGTSSAVPQCVSNSTVPRRGSADDPNSVAAVLNGLSSNSFGRGLRLPRSLKTNPGFVL